MKTREAMQRRDFTLGLERQVASSSSHRNIHRIKKSPALKKEGEYNARPESGLAPSIKSLAKLI